MENTSLPAEEISKTGENIFTMVVHLIIFLFGVPGNCLILRVYWPKSHKTSIHVLIMALAWADLSVCLLRVQMIAERALLLAGEEIPWSLHIIEAFSTTSVTVSVLVTAVIAADRYDCVCRSRNRFFTTRRAKRAVWASLLFSLITNIPKFIEISTESDSSKTVLEMLMLAFQVFCFMTALAMIIFCYGLVYMTIRKHVKVCSLFKARQDASNVTIRDECPRVVRPDVLQPISVVPMTACISQSDARSTPKVQGVFSVPPPNLGSTREGNAKRVSIEGTDMITRDVSPAERDARVVREEGNPRPEREPMGNHRALAKPVRLQRKTTRMLFLTSVVFLLTWLPHWTSVFIELVDNGGATINPTLWSMIETSSVTFFINNAVNPLIYGLANRRFRKDCSEVLRKIKLC